MSAALVTGASSGIGRALARELAARGHDLLLVARDGSALSQVAEELRAARGVRVEVLALDLARAGAIDTVAEAVTSRSLEIDVLVNDAGVGRFGDFADAKWEELAQVLDLNARALTELTHRMLPAMRARRRGRILFVASTSAFAPGPRTAVYAASKAYVLALGQALAVELAPDGIAVTTLCPGRTDTAFSRRAGWSAASQLRAKPAMTPEEVARAALRALDAGTALCVPGAANRIFAALARILPPRVAARAIARIRSGESS